MSVYVSTFIVHYLLVVQFFVDAFIPKYSLYVIAAYTLECVCVSNMRHSELAEERLAEKQRKKWELRC